MGPSRRNTSNERDVAAAEEAERQAFLTAREQARRGLRPGPAPKRIDDVLSGLLARKGYARVLAASQLEGAWSAAAEALAAHSRPGAVKGGVLDVLVQSSAMVQELTFQKRRLLARLNEAAPQEKIKDLRFRVGKWE
jgi:predicted nucleic acid-binding Zn ribbon protein